MNFFEYRSGSLHAEAVDLGAVAAQVGTPAYVYSRAALERAWKALDEALGEHPHEICYAVKANSNLAVLEVLARLGSGFDIVSVGELERVLRAGADPRRVVFSGVGKRPDEMERALRVGIRCFNVESPAELDVLEGVSEALAVRAPVSLRVNPDVDARTHPYIATGLERNKFGIPVTEAEALYRRAARSRHLEVQGVDCHIGSQLTSLEPFEEALSRVLELVDRLRRAGIIIRDVDAGGGLGIRYRDETPPSVEAYASMLRRAIGKRDLGIVVEPGRVIAGNAGVLLTRVEYVKRNGANDFAIVDAAMNDFLRPALYEAWCEIVPIAEPDWDADIPGAAAWPADGLLDVVGPVCETGDFLGWKRALRIASGDCLAVRSAGAYGFVMSSNYNTRPRLPEVLVDGDRYHVARRRESLSELLAAERTLTELESRGAGDGGIER